jgi:leucine dehydrogenase
MRQIAEETAFVAGLTDGAHASGDPSPVTARGVYLGMELAVARALGRPTLRDTTVAIQGLGNVGYRLAQMLNEAGARLIVSDVNAAAVKRARADLGATAVDADAIYDQPVDVFAPCALGAVLSPETIPRLRAKVVAGGANNQLADEACGAALAKRGILYAPDYVINGGGIINVAGEILGTGTPDWVERKLQALMQTLAGILDTARESGRPSHQVADRMVEERLATPRAA